MNILDMLFGRTPNPSINLGNPSPPNLQVTLWPTFDHFPKFAMDDRLQGIRMNSAMIKAADLDAELPIAEHYKNKPLYFDIKGRQLRTTKIETVGEGKDRHLELELNHPITVDLPVTVYFKAGEDAALCTNIINGNRLVFRGGPHWNVYEGESIHIRHPSLQQHGPIFTASEIEKIEKVRKSGFTDKWYLSYVEGWREIEEFQELVGKDAEIRLKIESQAGLRFVSRDWEKREGLSLVAARGDLYVELDYPHEISRATKLIIQRDPEATVGSRMLLSTIPTPDCKKCGSSPPTGGDGVPSCSDFGDIAWLYDIGYRNFLLCDELCLKGDLLGRAVTIFDKWKDDYCGLG